MNQVDAYPDAICGTLHTTFYDRIHVQLPCDFREGLLSGAACLITRSGRQPTSARRAWSSTHNRPSARMNLRAGGPHCKVQLCGAIYDRSLPRGSEQVFAHHSCHSLRKYKLAGDSISPATRAGICEQLCLIVYVDQLRSNADLTRAEADAAF